MFRNVGSLSEAVVEDGGVKLFASNDQLPGTKVSVTPPEGANVPV